MDTKKDLLDNELTPTERELYDIYLRLKTLAGREDLTPCVRSNVRAATAVFAQIVNDLNIEWEHLYDLGV